MESKLTLTNVKSLKRTIEEKKVGIESMSGQRDERAVVGKPGS